MIIPIFVFSNLAEYAATGGSVRVETPGVCPSCKRSGCLRRHTGYTRWAQEAGADPIAVRVERFLCRHCSKVLSALYSFLMPYRRYTVQAIAALVGKYAEAETSYREAAWTSADSDGDSQAGPSFTQGFTWVAGAAARAEAALQSLQQWWVDGGGDTEELEVENVRCPNSSKAGTAVKRESLDRLAKLARLGQLPGDRSTFEVIQAAMLRGVLDLPALLFRRGAVMSVQQRAEHLNF